MLGIKNGAIFNKSGVELMIDPIRKTDFFGTTWAKHAEMAAASEGHRSPEKPDFRHLLSLLQLLPVGLPCAGITAARPPLCSVILTIVTEGSEAIVSA